MPIFNLVMNSSNVIGNNNSTFQFKFIQGNFNVHNAQMCISQIIIPYSWPNISQSIYQNASFQYKWVDGTIYTVTLPDGFYQISDIQNYFYQIQIQNNQYLINSTTGQYLVFMNIFTNTSYYGNQILLSPVPTSLPTGYTAPIGFMYSSATPTTPQLIILNNNFQSIVGYTNGTYPPSPQTVSYNALSNITANLTPINSIIVCCDKINNNCTIPTNILDTFSPNTTYGSNINYTSAYEKWISMINGSFAYLTITLYDQNFRAIPAKDANVMISLLIKQDDNVVIPSSFKQKLDRVLNIKKLQFQDEENNI